MRKALATAVALVFISVVACAQIVQPGPPSQPGWGIGRGAEPPPKREKPPEFRTLAGVVLDQSDSPLRDAIVYLTNRKTKAMRTFVAEADGTYRFPGLSRTDDYEIYADLKGQKSPVKTLSSFDNRVNARLNLHIEVAAQKKDGKTTAQAAQKEEKSQEQKAESKDPPK